MLNFYSDAIKNLKDESLYRKLVNSDNLEGAVIFRDNKKLISFCSNDYLGLSHDKKIKKAAIKAIKKYGVGAGASRYVSGNNSLYQKLEHEIAKVKNQADALVFSSGYSCSIGAISALAQKGDLIIADKLIHASLLDGSKLSGVKLARFLHNDVEMAEKLLIENRDKFEKCLIITENIFSMDGDKGRVAELLKLAKKYDCLLIADDAHGLFLDGDAIKSSNNFLQIGTFSKALGSLGGYACGGKKIIDYLRNFAKPQIYSTALPPAVLASSLKSLKVISKNNLGQKALENAKYFCEILGLEEPESAIVAIINNDNDKVQKIAKNIEEKGFLISAIRPPTVQTARLRITFSALHKKRQIEKLAKVVLDEIRK